MIMNIRPAPATLEAIPYPLTAYKPVKRSLKEKAIENIIIIEIIIAFKPKTDSTFKSTAKSLEPSVYFSASQVVIMH